MDHKEFKGKNEEFLRLIQVCPDNGLQIDPYKGGLSLLWNRGDDAEITIDGVNLLLPKNNILCLTEFHRIDTIDLQEGRFITFNRPFYCVIDHDSEVSCKGALFFGASGVPVLYIPDEALEKFEILWKMFVMEMQSYDHLQKEMLQMMLKRLLILCTRLYKEQNKYASNDDTSYNLIREFNFLVEQHFRTLHTVKEYANLLNRSPKTLSNHFANISDKTPLQFIQERKMLEAKRLLRYTDLSIKEIGYETGFEDSRTFGRFFKNLEKITPSEYRREKEGKTVYRTGITV